MGKQRLKPIEVIMVKRLLSEGNSTHQSIADQFKCSRELITKIKKSMTDPHHPNSRWNDITEDIMDKMVEYLDIPQSFVKTILSMTDEDAGKLIKSICK